MKPVLSFLAPVGVALFLPSASYAATPAALTSASVITAHIHSLDLMNWVVSTNLAAIPEQVSMAALGFFLFGLAMLVRVGSRKKIELPEVQNELPADGSAVGLTANETVQL